MLKKYFSFYKKLLKQFSLIFLGTTFSCYSGNVMSYIFKVTQEQLDQQLLDAAGQGSVPGVEQALANGADIHADKDCALQWAAMKGHLCVVKFLLAQGANIHADNDYALRVSIHWRYWEIVAYLLRHGANPMQISAEELDLLHDSSEAQQYISDEILKAISHQNLHELALLLDIIPLHKLSEHTQNRLIHFCIRVFRNNIESPR